MSQYYDHYHRWEPLAEFHFDLNSEDDDDNYLYCLCSRAYIRDGVKTYNVEKEDGSESDVDVMRDSHSQEWVDHSHVHFSLDTSYKVKCEKDEGASCYCSASHTDNCCSTDEHDGAQIHGTSHALQPSDSGADLTYQDCHLEYTNPDKMDRHFINSNENYLTEDTWDKFWAVNGERLIWASWIVKYSDYINPAYLDDNKDLMLDENSIPKQRSVDQIFKECETKNENEDGVRERKFSYDSKVNPYKKQLSQNQTEKLDRSENKDESWQQLGRRRSCSEHERIVSPRTIPATDSMTNVTKITLSSYDVTSSHVTSESTPTDDYSVSSATSDDQSNDQTRIVNVDTTDQAVDDMDTDQYWQFLWKKHFGEQYAIHYANYIETHNVTDIDLQLTINVETTDTGNINTDNAVKDAELDTQESQDKLEIDCENSEGNSQDLPTVIEVQTQVEDMKIEDTIAKPKKRGKKKSNKYLGSVGILLQTLLKDEQLETEVTETGEENRDKKDGGVAQDNAVQGSNNSNIQKSISNTNLTSYSYDDGDDDPPEETAVNLKRSHEIDDEEAISDKIKATFEVMGFSIKNNTIPKGQMVYRKRLARLRPPRYKKLGLPKKTYFDEDGNPIQAEQKTEISSVEEKDMQTDDDFYCPDFKSEALRLLNSLAPEPAKELNVNKTNTSKSHSVIDRESNDSNINAEDFTMSIDEGTENNEDISAKGDKLSECQSKNKEKSTIDKKIDQTTTSEDKANEKQHTHKKSLVENLDDSKMEIMKGEGPKIDTCCESTVIEEKSTDSCIYDVQNKDANFVSEENNGLEASCVALPEDLDQSSENEKTYIVESTVNQSALESTKRRRRQKRYAKLDEEELSNLPEELRDDPKMFKYWKKRHSLFHRFDSGIRLDRESWFSVTPESVARHVARKCRARVACDAFCGAAGNAIQFAMTCERVIAIDIDPLKIELARHNAEVYGVADRIQFIVGDFFELAPTLEADLVFLSPPWGGPGYSSNAQYDIETMLEPKPASELMSVARTISHSVCLYLPRNTRPDQILALAKNVGGSVEVEQSYLDRRFVAITAYFY